MMQNHTTGHVVECASLMPSIGPSGAAPAARRRPARRAGRRRHIVLWRGLRALAQQLEPGTTCPRAKMKIYTHRTATSDATTLATGRSALRPARCASTHRPPTAGARPRSCTSRRARRRNPPGSSPSTHADMHGDSNSLPRRQRQPDHHHQRQHQHALPTMTRKAKNTIATGGRSSRGNSFSPLISPSRS